MLSTALANRLKRKVTIQHRSESGIFDIYGSDIPETGTYETLGELQQRSREEEESAISRTNWVLFLPAEASIDTNDVVTIDGETFEVIGDPWHAFNPRTGEYEHVEVSLRRTSGEEPNQP
jgi:hypothetical protein